MKRTLCLLMILLAGCSDKPLEVSTKEQVGSKASLCLSTVLIRGQSGKEFSKLKCSLVNRTGSPVSYITVDGRPWYAVQTKMTLEEKWPPPPSSLHAPRLPRFRGGRREVYARNESLVPGQEVDFTAMLSLAPGHRVVRVVLGVQGWQLPYAASPDVVLPAEMLEKEGEQKD